MEELLGTEYDIYYEDIIQSCFLRDLIMHFLVLGKGRG